MSPRAILPLILACLGAAPTAAAEARTDGEGAPLPPGAVARLGSSRFRHAARVTAVAYAPDGKALATVAADGTACLWDATSGQLLQRFRLDGQGLRHAVAFSPDGKRLAAVGAEYRIGERSSGLCVWEAASGKELVRRPRAGQVHFDSVRFSPDGRTVAVVDAATGVGLFDAATGERVRLFPDPHPAARLGPPLYAADGALVVVRTDRGEKTICSLWDVTAGKERLRLEGFDGAAVDGTLSPDGRTIAVANQTGRVELWGAATGKLERALVGHRGDVRSVVFSADGKRLASSGDDGTVRVWDAASGKELFRFPNAGPAPLAFAPDGRTLAAASGGLLAPRFWDLATGLSAGPTGHLRPVLAAAFSPEGDAVTSAAADGSVIRWEFPSGKVLRREASGWAGVKAAAVCPAGRAALVAADGEAARVLDLRSGRRLYDHRLSGVYYDGAALSADGDLSAFAVSDAPPPRGEFRVHVWQAGAEGAPRFQAPAKAMQGAALAFCPGRPLLAISGEQLRLWDLEDERGPRVLANRGRAAGPEAFSPDGRLLIWRDWSGLHLTEVLTGGEVAAAGEWACAALSPAGGVLALAGKDGRIRLKDLLGGPDLLTLPGDGQAVRTLAFSPDGKTLLSGGDGGALLAWDVAAATRRAPPARRLTAEERNKLLDALAGADAAAAYQALGRLAAEPEAVSAAARLEPASAADRRRLERLIEQLDDDEYAAREKASAALAAAGSAAGALLRKAAAQGASLEVRRRAARLLKALREAGPTAEERWGARALALLERAATSEAKKALRALAEGDPDAARTRDARAALRRLER
jgi:WD40 repeat protein